MPSHRAYISPTPWEPICWYQLSFSQLTQPTRRQWTSLQEPKILARLGFLYEGYSMAYWETIQMLLKLLLAAVPVFVPAQPYGSTQVRHCMSVPW